jgi:hypothetical protein
MEAEPEDHALQLPAVADISANQQLPARPCCRLLRAQYLQLATNAASNVETLDPKTT